MPQDQAVKVGFRIYGQCSPRLALLRVEHGRGRHPCLQPFLNVCMICGMRDILADPRTTVHLRTTLWPIGMVLTENPGSMLQVTRHDRSINANRNPEPNNENFGQHYIFSV